MCGIAGVYNVPNANSVLRDMLHALQNRGTDATGVVTFTGAEHYVFRSPKKVSAALTPEVLSQLPGNCGIGHNRYPTASNSKQATNIQPILLQVGTEVLTIAHNGNFTNTKELEDGLLKGTPFFSQSDTERFFRLILKHYRTDELLASIEKALSQMSGSCSAVMMRAQELVAIRDSSANRPLYWGKLGRGYVVASETSALDDVGVFEHHEVLPGTIMSFSPRGIATTSLPKEKEHRCVFEYLYFANPTSHVNGIQTADFRRAAGRALNQEHGIATDLIVAVPDSSTFIGEGYQTEKVWGRYDQSIIIRKHDTGRTFIMPGQAERIKAVEQKFSFRTDLIAGKSITVIDDSVVRSTTSYGITQSLRERGATAVHWRIAGPRIVNPCHYGINTPQREELVAATMSNEEIARTLGADSIEFLSLENFKQVIKAHGVAPSKCCFACMGGPYWH